MTEIRGLRGLKHLDANGARFASAISRLLCAQFAEDEANTQVQIIDVLPDGIPFFRTADNVSFCVANLAGLSRLTHPSDIDAACDVLDLADDLLTHIERALSISLAPVDVLPVFSRSESDVTFEMYNHETKVSVVIPENHPNTAAWIASIDALPASLIDLPLLVQLSISGPRLPLAEASGIAGGDLLLLAAQTMATLKICTHDNAPELPAGGAGLFNLHSGVFCIGEPQTNDNIGEDMHADDEFTSAKQFGALQVPVTIRLPEKLVRAADIAALRPGGTLQLGAMVQGLVAELVIGGKILAKGEIVQMGDAFALLIEERNPITPQSADLDIASDDVLEPETQGEE